MCVCVCVCVCVTAARVICQIAARYDAKGAEVALGRAAHDESRPPPSHPAPTTEFLTDEAMLDILRSSAACSAIKEEPQEPGAHAHKTSPRQTQEVSSTEQAGAEAGKKGGGCEPPGAPARENASMPPRAATPPETVNGQGHDKQGAARGELRDEKGDKASDLDGWTAVLNWAENIMGASLSRRGQAGAQVDASRAAAQAFTGDRSDLARDMARLQPHADGVWVVDDGLEYHVQRPAVIGVPGGEFHAAPGSNDAGLPSVAEGDRERQEDEACAASQDEGEEGGGWIYASAFPLGHGDSMLLAGAACSQPEPLHFVRWRRWLRRRKLRTVERRLVRVEASLVPGNRVGDVEVRSVPASSLAICNLSAHRLYVGIYVPLDGASNLMVLREGEVLGLGINAVCRALHVKGNKCILVAARRWHTLPPLLTRDVTKALCVVVPESLFKRVYLSVVDAQEQGAASNMACAAGEDGVVALNALQREIYLKAKPDILHRLQLQARCDSDERWEQDAMVRAAGLSEAEHQFVRHRRRKVHANLTRLLGLDLDPDHVPCVSLCMGGGGNHPPYIHTRPPSSSLSCSAVDSESCVGESCVSASWVSPECEGAGAD